MGGRGFVAAAVAAAAIAVSASAGLAAPAGSGSVTVRQGQWVGLQMDIAGMQRGGRLVVRPAQANGSVTQLRSVVQICRQCVVGINGDFFNTLTRQPIGGVIVNGVVLRSPNAGQNQLTFRTDRRISAGPLRWLGHISSGATALPVAVNDPGAATPVLYDRHFGAATPGGPAMELAFVLSPSALYLGRDIHLGLKGTHAPGGAISPGEVVLRATGGFVPRLQQLQARLRTGHKATLHLATDPMARNSLGANHILLRDGHLLPLGEDDAFVNSGNPRTLFGWDKHGRVTLVTIGSAVPGRRGGVSLPIAAALIKSLGVTNAVNLDGGGSSTFVSHGQVLNHPSDGSPRAVANAWVIVPRPRRHTGRAHAHAHRRAAVAATRRAAARLTPPHTARLAAPTPATLPTPTPAAAVPAQPPPTTTTTTPPAPRSLAERRPTMRAAALRLQARPGFDPSVVPVDVAHPDPVFDGVLAALVVALGAAMSLINRRRWLPARPPRRGA